MAKEAKPAAPEGEAPKKSKKLLIIILAVLLLLIAAGGALAFLLLSKNSDQADDEEVVQEDSPKSKKKSAAHGTPPVFINLEPFTVNLIPEQGDQYLQVMLALEIEDAHQEGEIKGLMPKIRNNLTLILSSKKASELVTKEGKEKLAKELQDEINTIIAPPTKGKEPEGPVMSVLFTSFIIQ